MSPLSRKKIVGLSLLGCCAIISIVCLVWIAFGPNSQCEPAPSFALPTVGHERFSPGAHTGRPVVLVFWSTTCLPCKQELTDLQKYIDSEDGKSLVVAGICTDPENLGTAKTLIESLGIKYPIALDKDGTVAERYGVKGYPTTVVIDRQGAIVLQRAGYGAADKRAIMKCVQKAFTTQTRTHGARRESISEGAVLLAGIDSTFVLEGEVRTGES
jgi:cytochrome c biogenesis protein CcmG/thiol:disulfide interchange protein DsbE